MRWLLCHAKYLIIFETDTMATSKSELMTFQLCAKLFNLPLSIQMILFFCSSSLSVPVLVLRPALEEDEQTALFVTRQTAHSFKVLWGNMFHMLGKTPSSSVNNSAMFVYNMHLWEV